MKNNKMRKPNPPKKPTSPSKMKTVEAHISINDGESAASILSIIKSLENEKGVDLTKAIFCIEHDWEIDYFTPSIKYTVIEPNLRYEAELKKYKANLLKYQEKMQQYEKDLKQYNEYMMNGEGAKKEKAKLEKEIKKLTKQLESFG